MENSQWYAESVKWAAEKGIVTGIGDNKFAPAATIKREQMAAMLYRFSGEPVIDSADLNVTDSVSGWAKAAIQWAVKEKLITGMNDGTLVLQRKLRERSWQPLFRAL